MLEEDNNELVVEESSLNKEEDKNQEEVDDTPLEKEEEVVT